MSIAVNAVVHSSRLLRLALAAFACAAGAAAVAVGWLQPHCFHMPEAIVLACLGVAGLGVRAASLRPTARVLDVSGLGALRLSVQRCHGTVTEEEPLQLMPGSTIWSCLLVLRLRRVDTDIVSTLLILPDSVTADQFRRIAIAAKAIAGRDNKFFEINKIF